MFPRAQQGLSLWRYRRPGEGSGAALPWNAGGDDAQILDLAHVPWATAIKVGDNTEDDEESVARNTLEHGLAWAHHAFDKLILPATLVSFLCTTAFL
jgi:hypothetical protein